jgi:putative ABC transport system permease protein
MIRNFLKTTIRNIAKHRAYSVINIAGLAIGMACCIMIMLWVADELSYDRFHDNADQVYRVILNEELSDQTRHIWKSPPPLAEGLKTDFPDIVLSTRYGNMGKWLIQFDDKNILQDDIAITDPDFFEIFSFTMISGNPSTALSQPGSIVLTETMAEKCFGSENPLGKEILLDRRMPFKVTGVIQNPPANSHLQFSCLAPFIHLDDFYSQYAPMLESWEINGWATYLMLRPEASASAVEEKIGGYLMMHNESGDQISLSLQNLQDVHLHSGFIEMPVEGRGDIKYVYIFSVIAIFVLAIACINFMNLTTARHASRAREVGVRKAVGASRRSLVLQFLGESVFQSLLALLAAVTLVELALPSFNNLAGKTLTLGLFENPYMALALLGFSIFTGFIAGLYPAAFLSAFKPVRVLKTGMSGGGKKVLYRKILVIIQFSISILLIVCTLIVSDQMRFIREKKLGFEKDHVAHVRLRGDLTEKYEVIRNELLGDPGIVSIGAASSLPTDGIAFSTAEVSWEGKNQDQEIFFNFVVVSPDYIETMGIGMAEGRDFSREFPSDAEKILINESAAKIMSVDNPLGMKVDAIGGQNIVLGVVEDYHYESMHHNVKPLIMFWQPDFYGFMFIRLRTGDISKTLANIEAVVGRFSPDYPVEFGFLDQDFEKLYRSEQRMGAIFGYFTALAIFISCLGLFSLASYMAEKRTKEIGIRKVLGASVSGIILLLSREFTGWVLIANLIAWPLGWLAMNKWLQSFAYRTDINLLIFVIAALAALTIAILTVIYQAVKVALSNPVKALRHE